MFFSVIIPTYNRAGWVGKTIASVLAQNYPDFEVIVVDDGSTDNTTEVIEAIIHPGLKYFKTQNRERGAARNFGISKAVGNYVLFIDSDDIIYPHCLKVAWDFIEQNSRPEIFHVAHEIRDMNNNLVETTVHINNFNEVLIKGNPMACMNVFVRRDVANRFRFNENRLMAGFEDWELWLRLASHYTIPQVKTVSGLMFNHDGRSSNNHSDKDKLIRSIDVLMESVLSNNDIVDCYTGKLYLFRCSCYTYIALHLAISGRHKKHAVQYLLKGLRLKPAFIFEKRFGAIIKHLLLA